MSLPTRLPQPMLASPGALPDLGDPPVWATEMKWDGLRAVIGVDATSCRIMSRNGNDLSRAFPELTSSLLGLAGGRELILDGEIVSTDENGVPRFDRVQRRIHVRRPARELVIGVPAQVFLFDVLAIEGDVGVMDQPYRERRERLFDLGLAGPAVMSPPHWLLPANQVLEVAAEHQLEGVVVKKLDSPYVPGARSRTWIKVALTKTAEVLVVGTLPSTSSRRGEFGALLVAAQDNAGDLILLGAVGSGFSTAERRLLQARMKRLVVSDSPLVKVPSWAHAATWLYPVLVGEVRYREQTPGGLRHPVWRGLRIDRDPSTVRLPPD